MSEEMERPQNESYPEPGAPPQTEGGEAGRRSPGFEGYRSPEYPSQAEGANHGHPNQGPVVSYCRVCGRGLTTAEARQVQGVVYCAEHAPRFNSGYAQPPRGQAPYGPPPPNSGRPAYGLPTEPPSPYSTPYAPATASPGLAFLLGLVPGVGAVYNAQYVKAIVHVVVLGLLISIVSAGAADHFEPLFGLLIAIWFLYMPFEAYHTARKRSVGLPVDDVSSIFPMRSGASGFPVGPVVLIGLGVVFMLAQFDLISFASILRYWPLALILAGAWMLYERMAVKSEPS